MARMPSKKCQDKTIDNLSENVSKIRDIVSKYNVNVPTETRTVFDTFNTYYHEHYLATIARTQKSNKKTNKPMF